ncbi:tRNA1(Val) (adenine(37)-N6)-methyltransferase [Actibacterium ureilyticum]|uniref:tRNA1(Val) (adenine(37)-N6)-methyltransferase n=1 Tax=Actibacterium ureilyticum TaxID=1590614 RepID=UPI000BAAC2D1|nr:methyltransferase domain-containing protein [Actibacterium ureilyticum]
MAEAALSCDRFLNGRLAIWQPRAGFRAGVDAVLLAAAVPAQPGERVLELGCGVGTASLCLAARVPGLDLTAVELQPDYAALAIRNAAENGMTMQVVQADLTALPPDLRQRSFDHVFANPPYYQRDRSVAATDPGRETALGGDTPLSDWVDVAARRLAPKGYLTMIQRVERVPDLLSAVQRRLGSIALCPLVPRKKRAAKLVLLRARKDGRAAFRLLPEVVLHQGAAHEADRPDYTPDIHAVLQDGAAFPWPDAKGSGDQLY